MGCSTIQLLGNSKAVIERNIKIENKTNIKTKTIPRMMLASSSFFFLRVTRVFSGLWNLLLKTFRIDKIFSREGLKWVYVSGKAVEAFLFFTALQNDKCFSCWSTSYWNMYRIGNMLGSESSSEFVNGQEHWNCNNDQNPTLATSLQYKLCKFL